MTYPRHDVHCLYFYLRYSWDKDVRWWVAHDWWAARSAGVQLGLFGATLAPEHPSDPT